MMTFSTSLEVSINDFPVVTADEMREIDRIMIEDIGISLEQMMENAGLHLAELVRALWGSRCRVAIMIGKGNNGGGGLVAARHLANRGHPVCLILATPGHYLRETAIQQLRIINNMQLPYFYAWEEESLSRIQTELSEAAVIIDALIGYSLVGKPQDVYADLIRMANAADSPVLSLDIPSGLHPTSGQNLSPCIRAHATLTLAAPKAGLIKKQAAEFVGDLYVADISVPSVVWKELGYDPGPLFLKAPVLKLSI